MRLINRHDMLFYYGFLSHRKMHKRIYVQYFIYELIEKYMYNANVFMEGKKNS